MAGKGGNINGLSKLPENVTRAARNRELRRDNLRADLAERMRIQHIALGIYRLENEANEMTPQEIQALGKALDIRMKMLNKYLPDLKAEEVETAKGTQSEQRLVIDVTDYKKMRDELYKHDDI